jgi:hypothetical protein
MMDVELGKAQGSAAVAAATKRSRSKCQDWQRRKSFAQGSQLYAAQSIWGSGSFASPFHSQYTPPRNPYLVLPAPHLRPLVHTHSNLPSPPTKLLHSHSLLSTTTLETFSVLLGFGRRLIYDFLCPIFTIAPAPVSYPENLLSYCMVTS